MTERAPQFVTQSRIAEELGVTRAAVTNWKRRFPDAVPTPAAYMNGDIPLWTTDQLGEWREFQRRRGMSYSELIEAVAGRKSETEPAR